MAVIIGWGHTKFGRLPDTLESLIQTAGREALDHAGLAPRDVGGIWLGHFNAGMSAEEAGVSFPEIFAHFARAYAAQHGDQTDAFARIAVKNHANAMANPLAHMHKPLIWTSAARCPTAIR